MVKKIIFLILSGFFLAGCFAESMTLVQSGVGASQGRILQSTITPAVSFGVKKNYRKISHRTHNSEGKETNSKKNFRIRR